MLALAVFATSAPGSTSELPPVHDQEQAQETAPIPAVWRERKLSFTYSSASTIYSCRALSGRVASVLRAVGARDDLDVRVTGCSDTISAPLGTTMNGSARNAWEPASATERHRAQTTNPRQFVSVYVRAMMPTEVTAEVLEDLKKEKSRRELVSRVTANPAARFNDPIIFGAHRQFVTLSRDTIGIEPEECEALDQMSVSVFRDLGVRVVSRAVLCSRDSNLPPQLVAEALLPITSENPGVQPTPAAGDEDADPTVPPASGDDDLAEPEEADRTTE